MKPFTRRIKMKFEKTPEMAVLIKSRFESGESLRSIADTFGIARSTLTNFLIKNIGQDEFERIKTLNSKPSKKTKQVKAKKKAETPKPRTLDGYVITKKKDAVKFDISINGKSYILTMKEGEDSEKLIKALLSSDVKTIDGYLDTISAIMTKTNNQIRFEGEKKALSISEVELSDKWKEILARHHRDKSVEVTGLVNFVNRLKAHNRLDKLDQLYEFLKHNDIKIIESGAIVGWKYLTNTKEKGVYVDSYSKKIKQRIGSVIETDESNVDSNPDVTCSRGLHVGSWNYVKNSTTIAKVLVNPEDVVAIPTDYDGMKMRCKKYYIIDIQEGNRLEESDFASITSSIPKPKFHVKL